MKPTLCARCDRLESALKLLEEAITSPPKTPDETARLKAQRLQIDRLRSRIRLLANRLSGIRKRRRQSERKTEIRHDRNRELRDEVSFLLEVMETIDDPRARQAIGLRSFGAGELRERISRYNRALKAIVCLPDGATLAEARDLALAAVNGPRTTFPDGKERPLTLPVTRIRSDG